MSDDPKVMVESYRDKKRKEILDMEPGRELDKLVAEKVMGYKRSRNEGMDLDGWDKGNGAWSTHFNPSTDISAAWEVVEKMDADGWDFSLNCHKFMTKNKREAIFGTTYRAQSESVPEAICKAALLAVMNL